MEYKAIPVNWFDRLGRCQCGKAAVGLLRGMRNESYGPWCERCANKKLNEATREREKARKP